MGMVLPILLKLLKKYTIKYSKYNLRDEFLTDFSMVAISVRLGISRQAFTRNVHRKLKHLYIKKLSVIRSYYRDILEIIFTIWYL